MGRSQDMVTTQLRRISAGDIRGSITTLFFVIQYLPCLVKNLNDFKDIHGVFTGKTLCQMVGVFGKTLAAVGLAYLTYIRTIVEKEKEKR
jgi:hypothetical protein